ncbi:hypothetical protein [Mycolicibacterium fortuitum]|uniref:hypothetical protein n=1 Tax=Mycolicibacterium fortuitum TaxID=1766 RepID=UPI00148F965B|nr:hypothetical protein [Mycolicibacterium fortuitum]
MVSTPEHWQRANALFEKTATHVGDDYLIGVVYGGTTGLIKISKRQRKGNNAYLVINPKDAADIADALVDIAEGLE